MANKELPIPWEQVKLAAVAGVPFVALARQYGLTDKQGKPSTGAIRVRAMREEWPVPSRMLHHAKKRAREANQALEEARRAQPYHIPSQAYPPNVLTDTIYRDTGERDMEPGLLDLGFMGESPNNQGIQTPRNGNQGSREAGIRGDSSGIPASKAPMERESGGNQSITVPGFNGGGGGIDASNSLTSSESTAATLIQAHMATLAQESILQALQRAHASIHAAPKQLPIATITDLRSAMKLAMEATGLDSKQGNQTLNILVSPTPKAGTWNFHDSPESLTIDAE